MRPPSAFRATVPALAFCCLISACTPDTEEAFRDEVSAWLSLGDTLYFNATRSCTAALFEVRSGIMTSAIRSVTSWPEAQRQIAQGRPVAFSTLSASPSEFTGALRTEVPHLGTQFLSAGLAARNCMDAPTEALYHAALNTPAATVMFDPETQTLGILQVEDRRLFIGRGEL